MGGSGGGSRNFGREGGIGPSELEREEALRCGQLTGRADIASPQPDVVIDISKGDRLSVSLSEGNEPPVIALTNDGRLVGALMPRFLVALVSCLQGDYKYEAEVLSVDGGAVTVHISPVQPQP